MSGLTFLALALFVSITTMGAAENFEGPWVLDRIAYNYADDPGARTNAHEFAGKSLADAVGKALDWNAERVRQDPDTDAPIVIERRTNERWVEVDWEQMVRPLD